ncbi:Hypothetical protein D9617_54g000130 [Elsinoe fawcettii]|nr:Hypothetical protein D9617_54g000130 [Elsinoe fawcettii]
MNALGSAARSGAALRQQGTAETSPSDIISTYLVERSASYRRLRTIRELGWRIESGDAHFNRQRKQADHSTAQTRQFFYRMMQSIGQSMNDKTGALRIDASQSSILDFCMAPGGFLSTCLRLNPSATATAFSLPEEQGGHQVLLPPNRNVSIQFLDITMLAADMGTTNIPPEHPDANSFLPQTLPPEQKFNLIICDGHVLRTHSRASYRGTREASRLIDTQLALGVQHIHPGGTMVVLLHHTDGFRTIQLLRSFSKFSSVQLYKHKRHHAQRSSFYMVAKDVRPAHLEAVRAVEGWKEGWKTATFGTEEEMRVSARVQEREVREVMADFGEELIGLAEGIWEIQADAIQGARWFRNGTPSGQGNGGGVE